MMKKPNLDFLVPAIAVLLFGVCNLLGLFATVDNRAYDLFLHLKPDVPENRSILIIKIDDTSIAKVGSWPWSRSVMADGLITMKEFRAAYAVFDIEYVNPSPLGVDAPYLKRQIPRLFNEQFSGLNQNITQLFAAIQSGSLPLADAGAYVQQLTGMSDQSKELLLDRVQAIARDNDTYLGRAARFFGHAYFTVDVLSQRADVPPAFEQWVLDHDTLKQVVVKGAYGHEEGGIHPTIEPILSRAAGAGFPVVIVDPDGVRRRVDLVAEYKGKYFGQLAFAPLMSYLGNPEIDLYAHHILLRGAHAPGESPHDISIPLTPKGNFLLNWPKRTFANSFRQMSFYYLVRYEEQEDALLSLLHGMADANYLSFYPKGATFFQPYDEAEAIKQKVLDGANDDLVAQYRQLRESFFVSVGRYLSSDVEKQILEQIHTALAAPGIAADQRARFDAVRSDVENRFDQAHKLYAALMESRSYLSKELAHSFCIIGATATSTTDFGVNPFDKQYANVGTHATVVNSILTGRFIDELPAWYATILTVVAGIGLFFAIRRRSPLATILIGVGFIVAVAGGTVVLFVLTRVFLGITAPLVSLLLIFITLTVMRFLSEAREKSYIRTAFGRYLSGAVINELLADPDKLSLGGEQKELTAFFSDVRGFSTISEQLTPADLVTLLNAYLTAMSDIILEERGTIDKYEGDAIISFFGAPISYADHPARACAAALRMKRTEALLNERFAAEKAAPGPLLTRIGINTGEMVVGNMGTANKMDYTIMGNSVNLASRLEGVNKQYGTWVLVSEATRSGCANGFLFRRLDRVRVVGIQKAVQLYELVGEESDRKGPLGESVDRFNEALSRFEEKDWARAKRGFEEILKLRPEDGPSATYVKRCEEYLRTPPPAGWDGVFSLSMK